MAYYHELEQSGHEGRPFEHYRFVNGANEWNFLSSDFALDRDDPWVVDFLGPGEIQPVPIKRASVKWSDDAMKHDLAFTTARDNPLVTAFFGGQMAGHTSVSVTRYHYPMEDDPWYAPVIFRGRIISVEVRKSEARIKCESIFTSLKRPGLRAKYQILCRHVLYGKGCGLSKENFAVSGTVSAADYGGVIQAAELAAHESGWFTGGFAVINGVYRTIRSHAGDEMTLVRSVDGVEAGDGLVVYPGCNHHRSHCKEKFGNFDNYGGFPYIPSKNPFSGLGNSLL